MRMNLHKRPVPILKSFLSLSRSRSSPFCSFSCYFKWKHWQFTQKKHKREEKRNKTKMQTYEKSIWYAQSMHIIGMLQRKSVKYSVMPVSVDGNGCNCNWSSTESVTNGHSESYLLNCWNTTKTGEYYYQSLCREENGINCSGSSGKVSKTSLRVAVVVVACFANWLFLYSNGTAKLHPKLYFAFRCAVCSIQHFRERKEGKKRWTVWICLCSRVRIRLKSKQCVQTFYGWIV